ncbi:long-chain fatty acid--CoA ligase [Streptomyces sp. A7024]|uniref:Acyl-CoA synthetase n=1 Tax=Streptomyces coryli TaxID=1128680 RepID=A0A6G4TUH0_9ACTN|nr:long-chain fatty acid--CoA ligase [Streptomyces coryli]NGN63669.1 long-chain fatty acid--CoA ligase [Streptomyces coryli]
MTEPQRPRTLALFTEWTADRFGELPALRGGPEAVPDVTYDELRDRVRRIARGLMGLGVRKGDRVAILAETRPEWTYAHFGVLAAGAVLVPVYPTAGDEEVSWVLSDSAATAILVEDAAQAEKVARLRDKLPELQHVVHMTGEDAPLRMDRVPEPAPEADQLARAESVTDDDLSTIIYTSGTTGLPKGCRLTHGNSSAIRDATEGFQHMGPGDCTYIYLPLAHLLAQLTEMATLLAGSTLHFFGGRIENIVAELGQAQPTHLPSVPRLFEKVHSQVQALAESQGPDGKDRFDAAIRTGVEVDELRAAGQEPAGELLERYEAADAKLFSLVRGAFGGRLRHANSGGAPIAPQTLDFLRACGIPLYEGYGMTESAGIISLSHPDACRHGAVGKPIPGCEVRIAEDGEILARGPMIFSGYHANEAATAEALDPDGWLHTGDLGSLDEDGYLRVTGRKKDIVITSAGKNLTPSLVEFGIQQSRWVSRAIMIGDRRPHPVALITLDEEEVGRLGLTGPPAREPRVRELVQEAVDAANEKVARPARIRNFAILDEDFSIDSGALTPTLKVRRAAVARLYAKEIDALYE